ncbi:MAG: hypothetical protein JWN37_705 [Candidatus Nomurabacteria bacterium]|nr:hypothetical protein [Candidatus Nomurabacteria bacterium]
MILKSAFYQFAIFNKKSNIIHMKDQEIFDHLFKLASYSEDKKGIVSACLVRNGEIIAEGFSNNEGWHAEYAAIKDAEAKNITISNEDIMYTTIIPCAKRTPGGPGEKYGDCVTNIINAGIKHVVYGTDNAKSGSGVEKRFEEAGVMLTKTAEENITEESRKIFNESCVDPNDRI